MKTADETLRAVADAHGDRDAYVEAGGDRLTFAEWDAAADGTAAALGELGVREGDVVALLLPSSADYAICYQAAMRLGAITSGINPRLGPTEVASILRRSRPRVVVGPLDLSAPGSVPGSARPDTDRAWPSGDGWPLTVVDRGDLRSWRTLDRPAHLPAPDPNRPVAIVWTSGTTGDPKGAVFDHRNLAAVSV
ncbi:MAG TPA: AMP-binding protein, partial [Acidimicrobiales bacterium]